MKYDRHAMTAAIHQARALAKAEGFCTRTVSGTRYVSTDDLARWRRLHPDRDPVAAYLARISRDGFPFKREDLPEGP